MFSKTINCFASKGTIDFAVPEKRGETGQLPTTPYVLERRKMVIGVLYRGEQTYASLSRDEVIEMAKFFAAAASKLASAEEEDG